MKKPSSFLCVLGWAAVLAAGCASTKAAKRSDASAPAAAGPAAASPIEVARSVDAGAEPDVRDLATREIPELKTVHFAYDSDRLDDGERAILRADADYLKSRPEMRVQVAGNCDQRGTVAYNLALGQRRAAAVRGYYQALGVEPSRVATISYGKERLVCTQGTEACWSRNRRAATLEVLSPNVAGSPTLRAP